MLGAQSLNRRAQTLTILLVFVAVAVTITSGAVAMIITGSTLADKFEQGTYAIHIAESGAENALLQLLRDPNYTGETIAVDGGSAEITVTGTTTKIVNVTGRYNNFVRKLQITAGYNAGLLVVTPPWEEVYP